MAHERMQLRFHREGSDTAKYQRDHEKENGNPDTK
jgi:hypothetical protein